MNSLPLVQRELRAASRRWSTFIVRMIAAGVATFLATWFLLFAQITRTGGGPLFATLATLLFLFCLIEGARSTADCISREKREGTLGLLFLTDLRGYDVVLGKLVTASLTSVGGFLAVFPVLSLPVLSGGVTAGEFWRMILTLLNTLGLSLALGLWVSVRSREERRATGGAALLLLGIVFGPWCVNRLGTLLDASFPELAVPGPLMGFASAYDVSYRLDPGGYWQAQLVTALMTLGALAWASLRLPRAWREEKPAGARGLGWLVRLAPAVAVARRRILAEALDRNPAEWLAERAMSFPSAPKWIVGAWLVATVIGLAIEPRAGMVACFVGGYLAGLGLRLWVGWNAANWSAEAKNAGVLELIFTTPLKMDEFIGGHTWTMWRAIAAPISLLAAGTGLMLMGLMTLGEMLASQDLFALAVFGGFWLVLFLDLRAMAWLGAWQGLQMASATKAFFRTTLLVIVVPWLTTIFPFIGMLGWLGWPIFWWLMAREKVRSHLVTLGGVRRLLIYDSPPGTPPRVR